MNNQSMQLQNEHSHDERKRRMRVVSIALLITLILFDVSSTINYISSETRAVNLLFAMFIAYIATAATAYCMRLIQNDRVNAGTWGLIFINLTALFISPFLGTGLGYIYGITAIIVTGVIASQGLERKNMSRALTVGAVFAVATIVLDNVLPSSGNTNPNSGNTYIILSILIVVMVILVARQFTNYTLRSKLLVAFISMVVVATIGLGAPIASETSRFFRRNLDRELSALALDRATRLGDLLNEQVNMLTTLALNEGIQQALEVKNKSYTGNAEDIQFTLDTRDTTWRDADAADNNNNPLVQANLTNSIAQELNRYQSAFPNHVEVFATDVYGGLEGTTNRTSDYYQADEDWWQAAYSNGEGAVYISQPEFDESANAVGIQIAVPVRNNESGEIIGVMRTTYLLTALSTILSEEIGETGEVDLFIPGDEVVRIHQGQLETATQEEFMRIHSASDQGIVEMEYEDRLSVVAQAHITTVTGNPAIDELGWMIVFHQQQDEAFQQITGTIQGVVIIGLIVLVVAVIAAFFLARILVRPISALTATAEQVAAGDLTRRADAASDDEVGVLGRTFNTMTSRLQETLQGLEERVAARTRNLELAAEVGRSVSQVRALDVMLKDAADIILKEFDLYYVQVYLTDAARRNLVLEAGTGDVGAQLLARAHQLPLNTGSINGRAAVEQKSVVISDTTKSDTFRQNPLLPDTRGEMAVPLIVGDQVVGVLDMQTTMPGKLNEEVLPAFEALAGQLAVAIQNANLVAEAEAARTELEKQARRLVRENWGEHLDAIHKPEQLGYVFAQNSVTPLASMDEMPISDSKKAISAPLAVTGEALGSLVVELDDDGRAEQTTELVNIVARQVAQQIENLRLLESAERYRVEAEKAARLQTVEGWQEYLRSRNTDQIGYLYDTNEVRLYNNGEEDVNALTLPVKAREENVGKLLVRGLTSQDVEELELANVVAERLGAHIESLRLLEETKRGQVELDKRAQQLAAVAEISTASSQQLEVDKLLSTVVNLTQRQFGLYHTHIFTFDAVTQELNIAACGWQEGDENEGTHEAISIPLDKEQSLVARAARTRRAVIVNDVKSEPGWLANPLLPDTASEMAVPLVIGDRILGVLDVQSDRVNAFSDEDANIQTTLASQVATAMQNASSFTQAQKQAERESTLNIINQKIQSATSVEAVLQIAARELGHALGAPMTIAQLSMKDKS